MIAEGFAATPNWMVRDLTVSGYAIAVYTALASHSGPGGIHPAQGTIAAEARCSESSVRRALVELEALGVVERVRRKSSVGRASNGYILHPNGRLAADEVAEEVAVTLTGTEVVAVRETGGSGQGTLDVPITEEEPIEEEAPIVPTATPDDLFALAWSNWPKKTEKKLSRDRFLRALKKRPTLANDVTRFGIAYLATTPTQFVPALAVWIGRERWDDELPLPRGGQKAGVVAHGRQVNDILAARERGEGKAIAS